MTVPISDPVIAFVDVTKSYGDIKALNAMDFAIGPGEIVGLLGPNGAGKSTLFQIAAGLFAPDGGTVSVFGLDYKTNASRILADLGVVFQARSVDLDTSVKANLVFHGRLFGFSGNDLADRITQVTELLEIADLLKRQVRTLSGGNQRRVEIARALLNRPKLLLLDEPSVGLDAVTRRNMIAHVQKVRDQNGTSILWATHLVEEVEHADRIILINKGDVLENGTPAELMARAGVDTLTDAYIALSRLAPGAAAPSAT
ncbi:MAG: transporter ATP-binding protein [Devosia sp.]|uniref:ABC transporter ATP-binding protein n=1 Tax=Devosia sp. TaxID=1871048 RepID=UPI00260E677F|nr:ATP-binding cassette domain-containing protein [Devosia sp.]MDB5527959.1 transporter ATP-binding protein [Devosia sp.]